MAGYCGLSDVMDMLQSMLAGNQDAFEMNLEVILRNHVSYHDAADGESFYHGMMLGFCVLLKDTHIVESNRESGYGRYDVMLEPRHADVDAAIILEFKVFDKYGEKSLEETVQSALQQIEEKQYAVALAAKGIDAARIRKYGFAFEGKNVLIGSC